MGIVRQGIVKKARIYLRENVYTPQAVLSSLDLAGGICSLKAYHVIYTIDLMCKDPYKTEKRNTVLPHEWRVRDEEKKLHKYCDFYIPMRHYVTKNGKCLEFVDIIDVTIKLCDAFGLANVAKKGN